MHDDVPGGQSITNACTMAPQQSNTNGSPPRMRLTTSTSVRRTLGSSGAGKYCSTRRHLTCSQGEARP